MARSIIFPFSDIRYLFRESPSSLFVLAITVFVVLLKSQRSLKVFSWNLPYVFSFGYGSLIVWPSCSLILLFAKWDWLVCCALHHALCHVLLRHWHWWVGTVPTHYGRVNVGFLSA